MKILIVMCLKIQYLYVCRILSISDILPITSRLAYLLRSGYYCSFMTSEIA